MSDGNQCNASLDSGVIDGEAESTNSTSSEYGKRQIVKVSPINMKELLQSHAPSHQHDGSLDLKIKMLNDVAVFKKRSPMAGVGNYFTKTGTEEVKDADFHIVTLALIDLKTN